MIPWLPPKNLPPWEFFRDSNLPKISFSHFFFQRKMHFQKKDRIQKNILRKVSNKNGLLTFPCKMHTDAPIAHLSWYLARKRSYVSRYCFLVPTLYHASVLRVPPVNTYTFELFPMWEHWYVQHSTYQLLKATFTRFCNKQLVSNDGNI